MEWFGGAVLLVILHTSFVLMEDLPSPTDFPSVQDNGTVTAASIVVNMSTSAPIAISPTTPAAVFEMGTVGPSSPSSPQDPNSFVSIVNPRFSVDTIAFSPDGSFPTSFNGTQNRDQCQRPAHCEALEETTCLGVQLPYAQTSLALTGFPNQRVAREQLESWSALRNIPRCWAVVQPLLCAVFFPRCDNASLQLPSQEMCIITRGPCRLAEQERGWPNFLQCKEDYPLKCKNSVRELKFNTTGQCAPPLVATEEESSWYEGVKGCGIQCANPIFTPEEHEDLHHFVATLGGVCLAFATFTVRHDYG